MHERNSSWGVLGYQYMSVEYGWLGSGDGVRGGGGEIERGPLSCAAPDGLGRGPSETGRKGKDTG